MEKIYGREAAGRHHMCGPHLSVYWLKIHRSWLNCGWHGGGVLQLDRVHGVHRISQGDGGWVYSLGTDHR